MTGEPKLGADTHLGPLDRFPQSVFKTVQTASLCYLERPTPASGSSASSSTWKMTDEPRLGADTHLDPPNRVPPTVWTTMETASPCYLERQTERKPKNNFPAVYGRQTRSPSTAEPPPASPRAVAGKARWPGPPCSRLEVRRPSV